MTINEPRHTVTRTRQLADEVLDRWAIPSGNIAADGRDAAREVMEACCVNATGHAAVCYAAILASYRPLR